MLPLLAALMACTTADERPVRAAPDPAPPAPEETDAGSAPLPPSAPAIDHPWTMDLVRGAALGPTSVVEDLRTGAHEGYDRVVLELDERIPRYEVHWLDHPAVHCGSGRPLDLAGAGHLEINLTNARAHTEEGEPTLTDRHRPLDLPVVRGLAVACDYEGHVTVVISTEDRVRFRVDELDDPPRLVVDLAHPGRR